MLFRSRDKAKNFCYARVQPCQRVWVADVAYFAQARTLADRNHAGATCPVLIHGDDEGALVAGKEKSACGMTKMVLDSGDCFVARLMAQQAEVTKFSRQASNFAHLGVTCRYGIERRNSCTSRGAPHPSSDWSACDCDAIYAFHVRRHFRQAELHRRSGQSTGISLARKLALFDDSADYAILDQGGRGVMSERR